MADPELDAQVERFERRLQPRARAEIEASISRARETWAPRIERYNYLLERKERAETELGQLRRSVEAFDAISHDLDWEYFRRLQLDGVLPALPRVRAPAQSNDKNDEERDDDDGDECSSDFEAGEKG